MTPDYGAVRKRNGCCKPQEISGLSNPWGREEAKEVKSVESGQQEKVGFVIGVM